MASKKSGSKKQQQQVGPINPFGPSVLVARGHDPAAIAQALSVITKQQQANPARFPLFAKGQAAPGSGGVAIRDPDTGEVRALQESQDYVTSRADLPDGDAPKIPGANLFRVDMVAGVRIVKPVGTVTDGMLGGAVRRFFDFTGLVPDPGKAGHVQAVWNMLPGQRMVPTPLTSAVFHDGVMVDVVLDGDL